MCAMYKSALWQFIDPPVRTTYESMPSPFKINSLVMDSQAVSENPLAEITELMRQAFSLALCDELYSRGLSAEHFAMQILIGPEKLRDGRSRIRVELEVIIQVPSATANQLIDAISMAKRRCAIVGGRDVKILLKAELKISKSKSRSVPAVRLPIRQAAI